jgi:hypothetical protein
MMPSHSIAWGVGGVPGGAISRVLNKSASGVLASLRGSTYRSVRLASSLAEALLDGLVEHPAVYDLHAVECDRAAQ